MNVENKIKIEELESSELPVIARVDFNNPPTIISYGDDVKERISILLAQTARLSKDYKEIVLDESKLNKVTSFGEELDETDKKKTKNSLVGRLRNLVSKVSKKELNDPNSYKAKFEKYCSIIQEICDSVSSQKAGALADYETRNQLIQQMIPDIELLEQVIIQGEEDALKRQKEIDAMSLQTKTIDLDREIKRMDQYLLEFRDKLNKLRSALVMYKQQIEAYTNQQIIDMNIIMVAQAFVDDSAPILVAQGSVMVFNHQQAKRIESLQRINDAMNEAVRKNAEDLTQNTEDIIDLSLNNGFSTETITFVTTSLSKDIELYKKYREERKKKIDTDRSILIQNNEMLDEHRQSLLQMATDDDVSKLMTSKGKEKTLSLSMKSKNR